MTVPDAAERPAITEDELNELRGAIGTLGQYLGQLVEVVESLADRQAQALDEMRSQAHVSGVWREHVMDYEKGLLDRVASIGSQLGEHGAVLEYLHGRAVAHAALARDARYDIEALAARLDQVRGSAEYARALNEENPLITVRIATYNRPRELVEVAIASVLRQTYQNFEIVVVSDGPSKANRTAVEGVRDPRVRYAELPHKTVMPASARERYLISGAAGMNAGARLAEGTWIAPLDDDDSFAPDHLEKLLGLARQSGAELVYGALVQRNLTTGAEQFIWSDPPVFGGFSFQGAMYLRALGFFEYDEESWLVDEAGDWGLVRRMLLAGVRHAATRDVVATLNMVPYWAK